MYWLHTMKTYRLYKNKPFLYNLPDEKMKYKGNLIFLDSKDKKDSIDIITNTLINNKYTRCYYIDKVNIAHIKSAKKKKLINQTAYYKSIKSSCKSIVKTYQTLDKYMGLSTYYDMSVYNELFFENTNSYSIKQKINAYSNFINHIFDREEFNTYPNKFIICKLDKTYSSYEDYKSKCKDFLSMVINAAYILDPNLANYPNLEVIIIGASSKRLVHFPLNSLSKKSLPLLKKFINIIFKLENNIELNEEEITEDNISEAEDAELEDKTDDKTIAKKMIKQEIQPDASSEKEIVMKLDEIIDKKEASNLVELEDQLNNDEEFLKFLEELKQEKLTSEMSAANTARNEVLKEKQRELKLNNDENLPTIEQIMEDNKNKSLSTQVIPMNNSKNTKELQKSSLRDFEKSYNENLDYKDKIAILNSMSKDDRNIKVYVRSISKEDSSTSFTKKETWTIELEDDRRVRHTVKVDFPIMINDKFMYIEGNKKILNKQLCPLPIIKSKPDTVQIVTNSNKTFITRFGQKTSPKMERFKKFLPEVLSSGIIEYKLGNNININSPYMTNIEYDELSENYTYIKIGSTTVYFNQEIIRDICNEKKFAISKDKNIVPIGVSNGKLISYNMTDNILYYDNTETQINLIDFIVDRMAKKDPSVIDKLNNTTIGKKYTYTRCKILSKNIPLLLFLAYNDGLSSVLHKAKVSYQLSEKRKILSSSEKETIGCIPFKNMYLYYDVYPLKNSLLLNSFLDINTKDYDYELFDSKEVYLEIFYDLYGSRAISKGFDNIYELFIDSITEEVLNDYNYPTKVTELFLYANELLQDNQYINETDMSNYRIRSNEMINVIFEKEMEAAYIAYKNSINGATPIKISLPQNAIINALTMSKYGAILQDYDTLNPIKEMDSVSTITYKGPSGLTTRFSSHKIILISEKYKLQSESKLYLKENKIRLTSLRTLT